MSYLVINFGKFEEFIRDEVETLEEAQERYEYEMYVKERDNTKDDIHIVSKEAYEEGNYDYLEKEIENGN